MDEWYSKPRDYRDPAKPKDWKEPLPTDEGWEQPDPIGTLYADLLGREPDKEGYDYWSNELKSGKQTYDQIADNIMRSAEYQEKKGRGGGRGQEPRPPMPIAPPIGDPGPRKPPEIGLPYFPPGTEPPVGPKPPGPGRPGEYGLFPTPGPESWETGIEAPDFPGDPGIRRPKPPGPGRPGTPGLTPIMPTPRPVTPIDPPRPKPPNATDWLQQAYNQAGLGRVDPGGRDYSMGDIAGGASKADVIANIMRHKK